MSIKEKTKTDIMIQILTVTNSICNIRIHIVKINTQKLGFYMKFIHFITLYI